jgi:hypothetical protein
MKTVDEVLTSINEKIMIQEEELDFLYELSAKSNVDESIEFCKDQISELRSALDAFSTALKNIEEICKKI